MTKILNKFSVIFILTLIFSCSLKVFFLDKFYSETDDRLAQQQILKYKNETLYSIANDKFSPTYNSSIKKRIREIENQDNSILNFLEKISSTILTRAAPAKHSTYAPMQYILFADLISKDQSYNELKFYSRLPSVIFSMLYIVITYLFCLHVFQNEKKFSLTSIFLLTLSLPLLYISLRSYNYAAGTFTTIVIFFLTYLELIEKNFSSIKLSSKRIDIKKSIYLGFIFSFLSYLNYSVFYILPIFFIACFLKYFKFKNILSYININLFITGFIFLIFSLPLLIQIFNMNLYIYGVTESTGGRLMEYHLSTEEKNSNLYVLSFYFKNFYLTITRNLSFFTDDFYLSKFLHVIIFLFVCLGIIVSRNENNNLRSFSNLIIGFFIYYFILIYFEVLTLGPTKHSNFYTPLFSMLFIISLRFFYNYLKPKYSVSIFVFFVIFTLGIFSYSLQNFYKNYTDVFQESYIVSLIEKYNVAYVSTSATNSDHLCIMKDVKILVRTCPIKFHRYLVIKNLDQINLEKIKDNNQSIMFINDEFNLSKYEKLLEDKEFTLIKKIDKTKFTSSESPLYISKYRPNIFVAYIYK